MLTADAVARHPAVFPSLFGVAAAGFEALFADDGAARTTPRIRKPGGGDTAKLDDRTQLLLALFWLRVYPTCEILGFSFAPHKTNARHTARAVLRTLDDFPLGDPDPAARTRVGTTADVMAAFPAVRPVIDAKEQRTQRPKGYAAQKPYDSGAKKAHALKSQVGVAPGGRIESVRDSYPGSVHDLTVLRTTAVIPPVARRTKRRRYRKRLFKGRNVVERFWTEMRPCRRVATRFDNLDVCDLAFVHPAATLVVLRHP